MIHLIQWFNTYSSKIRHHLNDPEYEELLGLTPFLCGHYHKVMIAQRIWHIKNQNFEVQKCKICGNPAKWDIKSATYKNFCQKCADKTDFTHQKLVMFYVAYGYAVPSNIEYKKKLISSTSFLDEIYDKATPSQRIWHIKNQNFEVQKCKVCGNPAAWYKDTYGVVCGKKCRNEYTKTDEWKK